MTRPCKPSLLFETSPKHKNSPEKLKMWKKSASSWEKIVLNSNYRKLLYMSYERGFFLASTAQLDFCCWRARPLSLCIKQNKKFFHDKNWKTSLFVSVCVDKFSSSLLFTVNSIFIRREFMNLNFSSFEIVHSSRVLKL